LAYYLSGGDDVRYRYFHLLAICLGGSAITGCTDENGDFNVGVSLGGTGSGDGLSVGTQNPAPKPRPDVNPDRMEDDTEYAVAYPNPITQNCDGVERTLQFVRHYSPYDPMQLGDRMDLLGINNSLRVRYKVQLIIKNTNSVPIYEYIDSCEAAFLLTGTKTAKKTETDYCLNDETVNVYQPNETRTYYYTFNLPNILQNWKISYHAKYAKKMYSPQGSVYDDDSIKERTQCDPLNSILLLDEYPSTGVEPPPSNTTEETTDVDEDGSSHQPVDPPPIFGGFDL